MRKPTRLRDHAMLSHYVTILRDDPEPTRRALAMAKAIQQHVRDVLDDDPGDGDDTRWTTAALEVQALVTTLTNLVRRS